MEIDGVGAVRVVDDVGHFAVDFDADSERLEVFNLGTEWIEMTGTVPIDSVHSMFYRLINAERAIHSKYKSLHDVAVGYLFETVGRSLAPPPSESNVSTARRPSTECVI